MSIVAVGSVAFDTIASPSGKVEGVLGGAATYFALAASYFTDVRVVAIVGEDFTAEHENVLKKRGVDTRGIEHAKGKTFCWGGQYLDNLNEAKTDFTDLNVFQNFRPHIPSHYQDSEFLFLANIQPELQATVRREMKTVRLTGGDTMNYWINDYRGELLETLKDWDFLLINDSEARLLSGEQNLRRAAAKILEMGPSILVIKRGEYGAVLFHGDCHFMAPGYLLEDVFDPTGAGDCFAGGFIGYLAGQGVQPNDRHIEMAELRRAVIYGSVMGSFCCEQFGVDRFRTLTRGEIEARYQEFKNCTSF
jgi:sugar/nucleoside kinase (ribokinase family)